MGKQELQKEIDQANLDISATNQRISKLREELAEAEKPKYRHGDFGMWKFRPSNDPKRAIYINRHDAKDTIFTNTGEWCTNASDDDGRELIIFGNIFNLLKEWSEDLTFFAFDVHHCEINTVEFSHAPIHIAGNWHTLSEAEEIWHKLGRVIATLKRKQS